MAEEIFTAEELAAEAERLNDAPEQPQERQDDRPRDEHGRFAPKQEEGQQPEAEQRDDKGNLVPQGALHAERERRKEAEGRWKAAQEQLDAIAQMRQRVQSAQPQADPDAPKPEADPAAKIDYLQSRLEEMKGRQDNFDRSQQDAALAAAEDQQLAAVLTTSEAEFRAQKPDYDAAITHVIQARARELQLYGLTMPEINLALQQEARDITRAAVQQGKSPAEVAYQLATFRGYRPGDQQQEQQNNPAAATIQAIQRAQTGSRSLGQAAGAAPAKDLNAQTIATMNDDEFEALYSTPEGRRMIDAL